MYQHKLPTGSLLTAGEAEEYLVEIDKNKGVLLCHDPGKTFLPKIYLSLAAAMLAKDLLSFRSEFVV